MSVATGLVWPFSDIAARRLPQPGSAVV